MLFLDMFRGSSLSSYNGCNNDTDFDKFLRDLGGTSFVNTFTPTPDTNRSMSTLFTGVPAFFNGCKKKGSSLSNLNVDTFFHRLLENGFSINACLYDEHRKKYLPQDLLDEIFFVEGSTVTDQIEGLKFQDRSITFIDLPDAHCVVNDFIAFPSSERVYNKLLTTILNNIHRTLDFDQFEYIFLFSDHGHSSYFDSLQFNKNELLEKRRTQILMHIKYKEDRKFKTNDSLHSIADVFDTMLDIIECENERKSKFGNVSFLLNYGREHIVFEEMYGWYIGANQLPEVWACMTPSGFYQVDKLEDDLLFGEYEDAKNILYLEYPAIVQYISDYNYFSNLTKKSLNDRITFSNGSIRHRPLKVTILVGLFSWIPKKIILFIKSVFLSNKK